MELLQNPFYILTASPRDNRKRIMELADERSLLLDSNQCMDARSNLTNPRKRLSAEIAWLPGIGLKRVEEILSLLESSSIDLLSVDKLSSTARANLLAAGLARLPARNLDDTGKWILEIAWAFEDIDPEELSGLINEERVVSGFPKVSDIAAVEAEVQERRKHYRQVIKSALDSLPSKKLVETVTAVVDYATDEGEEQGPILIADLVDAYEVEAQGFLDKEEGNIKALIEKIRTNVEAKRPDSVLAPTVNQLIQVVKNWDSVAQPIQVSTKGRGISHDASHRVASMVRRLAIDMYNEHGKLHFSQQLTSMMQEVFAEVVEVAERADEDADTLKNIVAQRTRLIEDAKKGSEQWRREITYEADVGAVFKDKLRISPEGIEWKGRRWDIDSIARIRWGETRHSVHGVPTGTTYSIIFGTRSESTTIALRKQATYANFIGRLWKAVGVRLLTEYVQGLRDGKKYNFHNAVLSDHGMELKCYRFIGSNDQAFCCWDELEIWSGPGTFCVGKREDSSLAASFSYQEEDNIHVIEAAIRALFKKGGDRLSSLLEG